MSLQPSDIQRIAKLANLHLDEDAQNKMRDEMNSFFQIVEQIQQVNTNNVEPLAHPTAVMQTVALRLSEDTAQSMPDLKLTLQNAPAHAQGVFIVPRVIE